jgi:hypothetical protein
MAATHRMAWLLAAAALLSVAAAQDLRWSDEFTPSGGDGFVNGGINTQNWGFHYGDGSDFDIPGGWVGERKPDGQTLPTAGRGRRRPLLGVLPPHHSSWRGQAADRGGGHPPRRLRMPSPG